MIPDTAEEFYKLRDDRTNRAGCDARYQTHKCLVTVRANDLRSPANRLMLSTVGNLLSRWCRCVGFAILESASEAHTDRILTKTIDQMRKADPFGRFDAIQPIRNADWESQIHLGQRTTQQFAPHLVAIRAEGFLACVGSSGVEGKGNDAEPLAAIAAACLGVSEAFRAASDATFNSQASYAFNILDLSNDSDEGQSAPVGERDFGRLLLIGAGAVGSAAAWWMKLLGCRVSLMIVDHDEVKIENLNRSPLFGVDDVGSKKANVVRQAVICDAISADAFVGTWEEFVSSKHLSNYQYDVWLPLANEHGVRGSVQANLPPLMIHASTKRDWGINHGRHIPFVDDCLVDRFPSTAADQQLQCSQGPLRNNSHEPDAALPFLSFLAGLLVVAELIRLQLPNYPLVPNFASIDLKPELSIQKWNRKPAANCICRQTPADLWWKRHSYSRFADLSRV